MLISILVPIYGVEQYIERCVRSLFNQTWICEVEFIFVNDCTKDGSVHILKKLIYEFPELRNRITIIEHKENRGLAEARQTALNHATGEYILTVDADDWIELNTCEIFRKFIAGSKPDILTFDYFVEYQHKHRIEKQNTDNNGIECLNLLLKNKIHGGTCLKLIRRDLFIKNNINYVPGLNMFEDISVVFRLFYHAKTIEKIDLPLYHYYQGNPNSYTTSISNNSQNNMLQLLDLMDDFFLEKRISEETIRALDIFKRKVYIQLMAYSNSISEFATHRKRLLNNVVSQDLSKVERLYLAVGTFNNIGISYRGIRFLSRLRKVKNLINNFMR